MVFGPSLIVLAGVTATVSLLMYATIGDRPSGIKIARIFYGIMAALVTVASVYLMYLFLTHRFEFQYVFAYSSLDLPLKYTVSSFWGGQEGTFLLWLFLGALLGFTIMAKGQESERWAMVFFLGVQLFLLVVLVVRSPFAPTGFEVTDGRGLNPLLQNPWMTIHPPIVFVGFAALAIPFAYAMAALIRKEYTFFPRQVLPWASLVVLTLGLGIFLGGYWAYKTLGWGGYWGWDPVENSSLIPWLVSLALIHGLLVQRRGNKLIKTNIFMAILALFLVIYGTFLTRSGVLADFSVHSFTDLGINAYLVGFMILLGTVAYGILLFRARSIKAERLNASPTSREFGLAVGSLLFLVLAFLVFLGTSAPLLTRMFGEPANVALSYYHAIIIPAGIALLALLVVMPFTLFGGTSGNELIKRATWPGVAAAVIAITTTLFVNLQLSDLALIFLGTWVIGSSIYAMFLQTKFKFSALGGPISHLGFGIMVLGVVASLNYGTSDRVSLHTNEPQNAMGYQIVYKSTVETPRVEDSYLEVELQSATEKINARPQMYYTEYMQSYMRTPYVDEGLISDLYVSPLDIRVIEEAGRGTILTLAEGEPVEYGGLTFTFDRFVTGDHASGQIKVGADLTIVGAGDTTTITPEYISGPAENVSTPSLAIPGTELTIALVRILVDSRSVQVEITDPAQKASVGRSLLTLEISRKPLMFLVWLGVLLVTFGSLLSFLNRRLRKRKNEEL